MAKFSLVFCNEENGRGNGNIIFIVILFFLGSLLPFTAVVSLGFRPFYAIVLRIESNVFSIFDFSQLDFFVLLILIKQQQSDF